MRWAKDGTMVPVYIFEVATLGMAVRAVCRCDHAATFNAIGVWWRFERKGWDDQLVAARKHFYCRRCSRARNRKVTATRLETVRQSEGDFRLTMPDERVWRRALSRVR